MTIQLRAEWQQHIGVLITWPHQFSDWEDCLPEIVEVYEKIVYHISRFQLVHIVTYNTALRDDIEKRLSQIGANLNQISYSIIPSNDTWIRDYAPLTLNIELDGKIQPALLNFRFNSWGQKYTYQLDSQISDKLLAAGIFGQIPMTSSEFVLEGGSIDIDGNGTLLTTRPCLLNPNRNPDFSEQQIEQLLKQKLGVSKILWISHGKLLGDDTDGHIDTIARFCNKNTIIYNSCKQRSNPHYDSMQRLENELRDLNSELEHPYHLIPCPLPEVKYDELKTPMPASYVNFLIINGAVLVPTYNDAEDDNALAIIQDCFPDREIIGINSLPLVRQNGSIHCATMQYGFVTDK